MNFSYALDRIKWGQPMSREAWGDRTIYVYRIGPPGDALMKREATGASAPWTPTQADIMASDWLDVPRID